LNGPFCSQCGAHGPSRVQSLGEFLTEGFEDLRELVGRLLPTLRLLITKPGFLTIEYLGGRKALYTHPVRLFFLCGAFAFLSNQLGFSFVFVFTLQFFSDAVGQEWAVWIAMLVFVPFTAVLLKLFFFRGDIPFLGHLALSLHLFSFVFLLSALEAFLNSIEPRSADFPFVGLGISLIYGLIAIRRVYGEAWWKLLLKGLGLVFAYVLLMAWLVGRFIVGS
jgi:hypothetical protein